MNILEKLRKWTKNLHCNNKKSMQTTQIDGLVSFLEEKKIPFYLERNRPQTTLRFILKNKFYQIYYDSCFPKMYISDDDMETFESFYDMTMKITNFQDYKRYRIDFWSAKGRNLKHITFMSKL